MTTVRLYWNHICVLHRQERITLGALTETLAQEGIALEIRYFGLGYPEHMSEYLAGPDAVLPDMIVSADLEVFEDRRIFSKISDSLYPVTDWVSLRKSSALDAVFRNAMLLPFVSIPLVYYTRNPKKCNGKKLYEQRDLSIGGINNSAIKTVVKTVWNRWGKQAARELLINSRASDMPIGAFHQVRTNQSETALVPSIYALRADEKETFLVIPTEGPLLVSSYACARTTIPEDVARRVMGGIMAQGLCDFYGESGDLIVYPDCTTKKSRQESERYCVPDKHWLEGVSPEEFYQMYCTYLATAKDVVQPTE